VAFTVAAAVTLRSGDPVLWPAAGEHATTIYVVSHGYHSGVVMPRAAMVELAAQRSLPALNTVAIRFAAYEWLEVGWGDEQFYRSVQTLASLNVWLAARALFWPGNASVLHVVGLSAAPREFVPNADIVKLDLSAAGFSLLSARMDRTFARAAGTMLPEELGHGLYGPSLFYRATGDFNIFHVCNHWVADLLDAAGVPTAPVLATLPAGLLLDLRWRSGLRPLPKAAGS
jgi:uncharacterized protein (TIGR02117 family)